MSEAIRVEAMASEVVSGDGIEDNADSDAPGLDQFAMSPTPTHMRIASGDPFINILHVSNSNEARPSETIDKLQINSAIGLSTAFFSAEKREPRGSIMSRMNANSQKRPSNFFDTNNATNNQIIIIKQRQSLHQMITSFVKSKTLDYVIITLVLLYTGIIFAYFALDTKEYDGVDNVMLALYIIQFIELAILIIFCFEIFLRTYTHSAKVYFQDRFNKIDATIIAFSLVLTVMDIIITDNTFSQISRIIRSIFRFVRLFIVFRKVNEISQTSSLHLEGMIKTPVEKIMDLLHRLKESVEDPEQISQVSWCMEMVSSNKLYEPILGDGEAAAWGNIYASTNTNSNNNNTTGGTGSNSQNSKKKKNSSAAGGSTSNGQTTNRVGANSISSTTAPSMHEGVLGSPVSTFTFKPILVPMEHIEYYKRIDDISFEIFKYHDMIQENHLSYLLIHVFHRYDIFAKAHVEPTHLFNWANLIAAGYQDNLYHNKMHAFDVTHMMHYFLQAKNFIGIAELSALEIGIMYMAAAAHDYEHPGFNNPFLVNSQHELAIRYNDKSPLENHHAFSSFKLMQGDNCNVFVHLSKADIKKSRERIINMILHTDNSSHFADLAKLKGRLTSTDFDPKDKDKDICMMALMHSADVSNPYKPWEICKVWTKKVLDEFWNQGDEERVSGMPITYLCDRYTTNTSKSQAGFIDFIVKPLYETVSKFLPSLDLQPFETNKAKWAELVDSYEEELKILQNSLLNEQDSESSPKEKN